MIMGIVSFIMIFLITGCCRVCRKRESLWIFVLSAVILIPFNLHIIGSVISFFEEYRYIRWFVKLALYPLLYMVVFCIEEILCGIIGRLIWKRQYVMKWE